MLYKIYKTNNFHNDKIFFNIKICRPEKHKKIMKIQVKFQLCIAKFSSVNLKNINFYNVKIKKVLQSEIIKKSHFRVAKCFGDLKN